MNFFSGGSKSFARLKCRLQSPGKVGRDENSQHFKVLVNQFLKGTLHIQHGHLRGGRHHFGGFQTRIEFVRLDIYAVSIGLIAPDQYQRDNGDIVGF